MRRDLVAVERLGLTAIRELSEEAVQGKVHSPTYRMAMEEDCCAVVHPAKLARGLADVRGREGRRAVRAGGHGGDDGRGHPGAGRHLRRTDLRRAGDHRHERLGCPRPRAEPPGPPHVLVHHRHRARRARTAWAEVGWSGWQAIEDKRVNLLYYRRTLRRSDHVRWAGPHRHLPIPDRAALRPQRAHLRPAAGELRPHLPAARRGPLHPCLGWAGGHDPRLPAAVRQPLAAGPLRRRLLRPRGRARPTSAARSWSTS